MDYATQHSVQKLYFTFRSTASHPRHRTLLFNSDGRYAADWSPSFVDNALRYDLITKDYEFQTRGVRFKTRSELEELRAKRQHRLEEKDLKAKEVKCKVDDQEQLSCLVTTNLSTADVPKETDLSLLTERGSKSASMPSEPTIFTSPSDGDLSGLSDDPSTSNASDIN